MRALSACLVTVLALGTTAVTACSSTSSDDSSSAGSGGASAGTAGSSSTAGKSSTGGTGGSGGAGTAGSTGEAGATCVLDKPDCGDCIGAKCGDEATACLGDELNGGCDNAFIALNGCVCGGTSTLAACESTFREDGGDKAKALADCFDKNCAANCQ